MGFQAKLFEIVLYPESYDITKLSGIIKAHSIKDYAYILHDKDGNKPHYHLALRCYDSTNSDNVSKWFEVPENAVGRVKGKWVDILRYLTHENATDKYRYDESEVVSNFDWIKEKERCSSSLRLADIVMGIEQGIIRKYNYHNHISVQEYIKYKKQIDNAFDYRTQLVKGTDRNMKCIFITGESGSGKTTLAKQTALNHKYSVYVSSGSNDVLDDYQGQDCIILDDLRPSSMGLSDLLKMLDNNTSSTVRSRYKNKILECKLIIITTTMEITTFFAKVFQEEPESAIQLQRRCETIVHMTAKTITYSVWQKQSEKYITFPAIPNYVLRDFNVKDMTLNEALDSIQSVLALSDEVVKELKNNGSEYGITEEMKQTTLSDFTKIDPEDFPL